MSQVIHRNALISAIILLGMSAITAHAGDLGGGSHGGGGNVALSSRADLQEIVDNMRRHVWAISDRYLAGGYIYPTTATLPAKLRQVTQAVLGSPVFSVSDSFLEQIENLEFTIVDGDCLDGGSPSDASTLYERGAPICLSAKRLSRFPKVVLREALVPLIFHELAHQYNYGEEEANALQQLASAHLRYRPIFLAAQRAQVFCRAVSDVPIASSELESSATANSDVQEVEDPLRTLRNLDERQKRALLMSCSSNAWTVAENLRNTYNGDLWVRMTDVPLSETEASLLRSFQGGHEEFSFLTMIDGLEGASKGLNCEVCEKHKVDYAYLMSLAARVALAHIDRELGQAQSRIRIQ